jgi:hypothetical protein
MPVLAGPRVPFMQREGAANPEAKAILDAAEVAAKVRAKVEEASIPYEDRVQITSAAELAQDAAQRARVAEAMIPMEYRNRPADYTEQRVVLKDDKQGIGFNTETLLAYATPAAVGAGIGALVGSKYAPAKKVGPYYSAGIGAVVGLAAFAAIQQFQKK